MTTYRQSAAYVDGTALFPIDAGEQPVADAMRRRLDNFDFLLSANLLEAEVREAMTRRGRDFDRNVLTEVRWIMPNRPLDAEMTAIAEIVHLPAARLWHLAVALFFDGLVPGLVFVTLDEQQETAARELGLAIP